MRILPETFLAMLFTRSREFCIFYITLDNLSCGVGCNLKFSISATESDKRPAYEIFCDYLLPVVGTESLLSPLSPYPFFCLFACLFIYVCECVCACVCACMHVYSSVYTCTPYTQACSYENIFKIKKEKRQTDKLID